MDGLNNITILIISCKKKISSLCFAYITAMTAAIAKITTLKIKYCTTGFIASDYIWKMNF